MVSKSRVKAPKELRGSRVKLRFKRHVLPVLAGLFVCAAIFILLNAQLIIAQLEYQQRAQYVQTTSIPTTATVIPVYHVNPSAPPQIIINKINVTAPVNFTETRINQYVFLQDLHNGTVHYPGTALPGQTGNVAIFGHSSGVWWEAGNYKFVFTLLDKLTYNDQIFVDYKGIRYVYQVYNTKVVMPDDMTVLNQGGNHILTLITCTPVGTSQKRLIVQAVQISPQVQTATTYDAPATLPTTAHNQAALPSSNPSFWGSLWHTIRNIF